MALIHQQADSTDIDSPHITTPMFCPKAYQLRDHPYLQSLTVLSTRVNAPSLFLLIKLVGEGKSLIFERMLGCLPISNSTYPLLLKDYYFEHVWVKNSFGQKKERTHPSL
jgi:hypothetical protein